jgi:hypothetical protein
VIDDVVWWNDRGLECRGRCSRVAPGVCYPCQMTNGGFEFKIGDDWILAVPGCFLPGLAFYTSAMWRKWNATLGSVKEAAGKLLGSCRLGLCAVLGLICQEHTCCNGCADRQTQD